MQIPPFVTTTLLLLLLWTLAVPGNAELPAGHPPTSSEGASCPFHTEAEAEAEAKADSPPLPPLSPQTREEVAELSLEDLSASPLVTLEELEAHHKNAEAPYLAVLGVVFDVSKGKAFYGGKGAYSFLTGTDSTLALIQETTVPVEMLTAEKLGGIYNWMTLFERKYDIVGRLVDSPYFDVEGNPTKTRVNALAGIDVARGIQNEQEREKAKLKEALAVELANFPFCRIGQGREEGETKFSCTLSQGLSRHDAHPGLPRLRGGTSCVCIPKERVPSHRSAVAVPGCDEDATTCYMKLER
eukprot:TRINITY_DN11694_c0_g1_i1.p1 TRINITY_DN11694_c0_g1~~TRINITY_DN11694_c0_g1_i1.p1  ORF type:complete len:299 (-),score=56.25 TRINITY_DN11694_c0_g1_i1:95-991(-)